MQYVFYNLILKTGIIFETQVLYEDSEDVNFLKTIRIPMPNKEGGLNREVQLNFSFDDEIRIVAKDMSSDNEQYIELAFDYELPKKR